MGVLPSTRRWGYRPGGPVAVCALIALAAAVWVSASAGAGSTVALTALEEQTTSEINELRIAHGLRPLAFNSGLFESADTHCRQMLAGGYFGHQSSTGAPFASRIKSFYPMGDATYYAAGENLLWNAGALSSAELIERWMHSPEHRRNLLNPAWREIGVATLSSESSPGIYDGLDVTVVTVDFGVRSGS